MNGNWCIFACMLVTIGVIGIVASTLTANAIGPSGDDDAMTAEPFRVQNRRLNLMHVQQTLGNITPSAPLLYLGTASFDHRIKGYAFVTFENAHPRRSPADFSDIPCSDPIAEGARWWGPTTFLLDPSGVADELPAAYVQASFENVLDAWNAAAKTTVFSGYVIGPSDGVDIVNPDGINEVEFIELINPNIIGVTFIWGKFDGIVEDRRIVETDVAMNTRFTWGDADMQPGTMDLEAIFTHELGHCLGLADLYTSNCMEATMYFPSRRAETRQRTLTNEDKRCALPVSPTVSPVNYHLDEGVSIGKPAPESLQRRWPDVS